VASRPRCLVLISTTAWPRYVTLSFVLASPALMPRSQSPAGPRAATAAGLAASAAGNVVQRSPSPTLRKRNPAEADTLLGKGHAEVSALKAELKAARKATTLFRSPIKTISIFGQIVFGWLYSSISFLLSHKLISYSLVAVVVSSLVVVLIAGPSSDLVVSARHDLWFVVWWVTLGILSSVGLGTGLHTFVLYLGPYIAMVTLAVTECDTMNVPLDGPNALVCPPAGTPKVAVTFLRILLKVLPACFLWGAGTAIGELPPYFVSRAARLSGQKLEELDELEEEDKGIRPVPTLIDRLKLVLFHALQAWGFWAIVVCASVPNPLFDLAGLTCGHFLIPFWTFFGATFIGKALVKVQIQSAFVILAFDTTRLSWCIEKLEALIPAIQGKLGPIFEKQRNQFHKKGSAAAAADEGDSASWISFVWNLFLGAMLLGFLKSIVESSVQERLAEQDTATIEQFAKEKGVGVTTRGMEQKQIEAAAAAAATTGGKEQSSGAAAPAATTDSKKKKNKH